MLSSMNIQESTLDPIKKFQNPWVTLSLSISTSEIYRLLIEKNHHLIH